MDQEMISVPREYLKRLLTVLLGGERSFDFFSLYYIEGFSVPLISDMTRMDQQVIRDSLRQSKLILSRVGYIKNPKQEVAYDIDQLSKEDEFNL